MSINTTPATFTTSQVVSAADLNTEIRDAFTGLQAAWTTYTPTWAGATVNPTIGNGTIIGRYLQVGKTINFRIQITFGTSTSAGTGAYSFSLPVTPLTGFNTPVLCTGLSYDASVPTRLMKLGYMASGTSVNLVDSTGGTVLGSTSLAWASSDVITLAGTYEAA